MTMIAGILIVIAGGLTGFFSLVFLQGFIQSFLAPLIADGTTATWPPMLLNIINNVAPALGILTITGAFLVVARMTIWRENT